MPAMSKWKWIPPKGYSWSEKKLWFEKGLKHEHGLWTEIDDLKE